MNKMTKVIVLGALTAGFVFVGCSATDTIENSASAGYPSVAGTASTSNGGTTGSAGSSSPPVPVTTTAGSSSTTGTAAPSSNGNGCSIRHGVTPDATLAGIALSFALAFAARRRRRQATG